MNTPLRVIIAAVLIGAWAVCSTAAAAGDEPWSDSSEPELHNRTRPVDFPLETSKVIVHAAEGLPDIDVYSVSTECYRCKLQLVARDVPAGIDVELAAPVPCAFPVAFGVALSANRAATATTADVAPAVTLTCGDRGVYLLTVTAKEASEGSGSGEPALAVAASVVLHPWSRAAPLGIAAAALVCTVLGVVLAQRVYVCHERRRRRRMPPQFSPIAYGDLVGAGFGSATGSTGDLADDGYGGGASGVAAGAFSAGAGSTGAAGTGAAGGGMPVGSQTALLRGSTQYLFAPSSRAGRVASLDCFRGIAVALMVFACTGGGGYWFFQPSAWNGLTVADVVLPCFVFALGAAQALSLRAHARAGRGAQWRRLLRRTAALVALGLYLNRPWDYRTFRVPGVLQRLGLVNLVLTTVALWTPKLRAGENADADADLLYARSSGPRAARWRRAVRAALADVVPHLGELVLVALLALAHTAPMLWAAQPGGCARGYLGPGGIGDGGAYANCTGGFAGRVDRAVFGARHLLAAPPACRALYATQTAFDPEGLWGTLGTVVLAFVGLQCGRVLLCHHGHGQRVARWALWAALCGAGALALCSARQNGGALPLNRNLWTLSFTLATAALACVLLIVCYTLVDVLSVWSGAPFTFVGMNSIAVYTLSQVLAEYPPFRLYTPDTHGGALVCSTLSVLVVLLFGYILYRKRIFIKL